jgi:hypothetical protein
MADSQSGCLDVAFPTVSAKEVGVLEYRLYLLDEDGHNNALPMIIECIDEQEALIRAMQFIDGKAGELWLRDRLILRLPSNAPSQVTKTINTSKAGGASPTKLREEDRNDRRWLDL